jgi:hypothetical protein
MWWITLIIILAGVLIAIAGFLTGYRIMEAYYRRSR